MKFSIFTLAIIPFVFSAEGVKLWAQSRLGETQCFATIDNDRGCLNACIRRAQHVAFVDGNWQKGIYQAKFLDPRKPTRFIDIYPAGENKDYWEAFWAGGDGKKVGQCYTVGVNDARCRCGFARRAEAYAWCVMDQ